MVFLAAILMHESICLKSVRVCMPFAKITFFLWLCDIFSSRIWQCLWENILYVSATGIACKIGKHNERNKLASRQSSQNTFGSACSELVRIYFFKKTGIFSEPPSWNTCFQTSGNMEGFSFCCMGGKFRPTDPLSVWCTTSRLSQWVTTWMWHSFLWLVCLDVCRAEMWTTDMAVPSHLVEP